MSAVLAATIVAAAMVALPFVWRKAMPVTQPMTDALGTLDAARANYDRKAADAVAAAIAANVAPVQAALDEMTAHAKSLATDLADSEDAVRAKADELLADSTAATPTVDAPPAPPAAPIDPTTGLPA